MKSYQTDFVRILQTENRYEALQFVLKILDKKELSILQVYEELLTPALNQMNPSGNEDVDIWKEHVRTSIIKTILENIYPYVMRERNSLAAASPKTVAILCPPEEYHNVGARMVADIFTLSGHNSIFVDSNTPLRVILAGMEIQKIDCVAISISNPYHLVSTRNIIEAVRQKNPSVEIIVGGNAIARLGENVALLGADYVVTTLKDLTDLEGGRVHETIL